MNIFMIYFFLLITLNFRDGHVRAVVPAGSVPYGSSCSKDEDCDPYTSRALYQVNCVKKSPQDPEGICGCIADVYKTPSPKGRVGSDPTIEERFNPANPAEGCRRSTGLLAACYQGSNSCNMFGLYMDNGEAPIVCRDVDIHHEAPEKGKFKCVGRERWTRTFGPCVLPYVPGTGSLDCSKLPNSQCVIQTNNMNLGSCVGLLPSGKTPLPGPASDLVCHHDSDCRDPNAECVPYYSETIFKVTYSRSVCLCNEASGYVYSLVNNQPVCILGSSSRICDNDADCGPVTTKMKCTHRTLSASYKTCECPSGSHSHLHEYFEGSNKDDASCHPVKFHGESCSPLFRLSRDHRPVDDCRKRNRYFEPTGLKCYEDKEAPTCACAFNTKWNSAFDQCVKIYADHNEVCGAGSWPCNPRSHLICQLEPKSTTTSRCVCDSNSIKDEVFPYCRPRESVVGYGKPCDEITYLCDDKKNIVCNRGHCACLVDERIEDNGKECRTKANSKSSKSFPFSNTQFFILLLFGWVAIPFI